MTWLLTSMTYFSAVFNQLRTHNRTILSGKHSFSASRMVCWAVLLTCHIHLTTEGINLSLQTTLYLFKFASPLLHSMQIQPGWVSDPSVLRSSLDYFFQKDFTLLAQNTVILTLYQATAFSHDPLIGLAKAAQPDLVSGDLLPLRLRYK